MRLGQVSPLRVGSAAAIAAAAIGIGKLLSTARDRSLCLSSDRCAPRWKWTGSSSRVSRASFRRSDRSLAVQGSRIPRDPGNPLGLFSAGSRDTSLVTGGREDRLVSAFFLTSVFPVSAPPRLPLFLPGEGTRRDAEGCVYL